MKNNWEKYKYLLVQVIIVLRATHNKWKGKKSWNPIKNILAIVS